MQSEGNGTAINATCKERHIDQSHQEKSDPEWSVAEEDKENKEEKSAVTADSKKSPSDSQRLTREQIEESMKQILDGLSNKRENDIQIMEEVKKKIMAQAEKSCELLNQHMASMHSEKGKELDEKLKKLSEVIDRIKGAEAEIEKTKSSLNFLCRDVSHNEV